MEEHIHLSASSISAPDCTAGPDSGHNRSFRVAFDVNQAGRDTIAKQLDFYQELVLSCYVANAGFKKQCAFLGHKVVVGTSEPESVVAADQDRVRDVKMKLKARLEHVVGNTAAEGQLFPYEVSGENEIGEAIEKLRVYLKEESQLGDQQ